MKLFNQDVGQYYGAQQTNQKVTQVTQKQYVFIDNRYSPNNLASNVDFVSQFNVTTELNKITQRYLADGVTSNPDCGKVISGQTTPNYTAFGTFKNVMSIELKGISIQNTNNHPYIVLDIKEINNRVFSNVPVVNQSFCVIYCEENKRFIKGSDFDNKIVHFNPPLSDLSRLTIKLKQATGTGETNVYIEDPGLVTMIFEITTANNTIH